MGGLNNRLFSPAGAPQAFIIGAPKCGTTALAHYCADHPDIAFARAKEPHYFSQSLSGLCLHETQAAYEAAFPVEDGTLCTMEGSVWYLYSQDAIERIEADRPDAKYIVMLRNPVDMAASLHQQLLNAFDEAIPDFETAWHASTDRAAGRRIPRTCRAPSTLIYTRTCALGAQIERFFKQIPEDRRLVLFQEELRADASDVYRRVLAFLGLRDDGRTSFEPVNEAQKPRSKLIHYIIQRGGGLRTAVSGPIKALTGRKSLGVFQAVKKRNLVKTGKAEIPAHLRDEVGAYFKEDIDLLCRLLERDLRREFGWP